MEGLPLAWRWKDCMYCKQTEPMQSQQHAWKHDAPAFQETRSQTDGNKPWEMHSLFLAAFPEPRFSLLKHSFAEMYSHHFPSNKWRVRPPDEGAAVVPLGTVFLSASPLKATHACCMSSTFSWTRTSSRCLTMSWKDGRSLGSIWWRTEEKKRHSLLILSLVLFSFSFLSFVDLSKHRSLLWVSCCLSGGGGGGSPHKGGAVPAGLQLCKSWPVGTGGCCQVQEIRVCFLLTGSSLVLASFFYRLIFRSERCWKTSGGGGVVSAGSCAFRWAECVRDLKGGGWTQVV